MCVCVCVCVCVCLCVGLHWRELDTSLYVGPSQIECATWQGVLCPMYIEYIQTQLFRVVRGPGVGHPGLS